MTQDKNEKMNRQGTVESTVSEWTGEEAAAENPENGAMKAEVARQLKKYRKQSGMTQENLAKLIGTRKSNISRLESGRYNPSLDFLVKVAGGLGCRIEISIR